MKRLLISLLILLGMAQAQTTTNLHLNIPTKGATNWDQTLNANFATLDAKLACFGVATVAGTIVYYNGSSWLCLGGNTSGTKVLQSTSGGGLSWGTSILSGDAAGGALAGNFPSPTLGAGVVGNSNLAIGAVTDDVSSLANKPSVGLVATANLTLSGAQTIDGVLGTAGQTLVLATAQTAGAENGPWVMQSGSWTRPTWYANANTTQAIQFATTFVRLGITQKGTVWRLTTAAPITIGTTATTWAQTTAAIPGVVSAMGSETVQQAMTAASTNGITSVPVNSAAVDVPAGTRIGSLNTPTIVAQSSGSHLLDSRYGETADSIYNPGFDGLTNIQSARVEVTNWNESIPVSINNLFGRIIQNNVLSGTQNLNGNGYTNKTNISALVSQTNVWANSQVNANSFGLNCYGNGDCIPVAFGVVDWGGAQASSDEGAHLFGGSVSQGYVEYLGPASAASIGATAVTVAPSQGLGTQGEGRPLYDITKAYTTGTITSFTGTGLVAVVGGSTSWPTSTSTTTSAAITVTGSNLTPGSVNIQVASSTGFVTNSVMCVADAASFEYAAATAVPDGTHITATFLQPHASGATISTGGMCGYGMNITADNWTTTGAIGFVTVVGSLRQIWPFVDSPTSTSAHVWISIAGGGDSYAGNAALPGAAYSAYPMTFAAPGTNNQSNTIPVQPLAVAFAASDSVAEALYPAFKFSLSNLQVNKFFASQGLTASGFFGFAANGIWNGADCMVCFSLNTPMTKYTGHGGHLTVPLAAFYAKTGLVRTGLAFDSFPDSNIISAGCPVNSSGTNDCTLNNDNFYKIWSITAAGGVDFMTHNPANGNYRLVGGGATQGWLWGGATGDFTSQNGGLVATTYVKGATYQASSGHIFLSSTAPTVSSGFGTSPSIAASNGTATFTVNVGTGGSATSGVVAMPAATAGWNCSVNDLTAAAAHVGYNTRQTASSTTSVTVENQTTSSGAAVAWAASDVLTLICVAY